MKGSVMFKILILICSASTARADCRPENALMVIAGPQEVQNQVQCSMVGQAYIASTGLVQEGDFVKTICSPVDSIFVGKDQSG